ncbi:U3 small nucleolar RNA-associated protein 18 homolog isoform X1 [Schistocerca americana]|uniref:U3 small nucleolar RNA-associated protein 18 homolog isoform X1 n=1 Tax=Schistocerca americana TaxID=7009 RepID=UPI001F4F46D4|nr:U3 small nucleolar RNA-associated protein 18 homolog isoform X1 [Schistocerca americana]
MSDNCISIVQSSLDSCTFFDINSGTEVVRVVGGITMLRNSPRIRTHPKKRKHEDDGENRRERKVRREKKHSENVIPLQSLKEEERRLERLVFGDPSEVIENVNRWESDDVSRVLEQGSDPEDSGVDEGDDSPDSDSSPASDTLASPERQPAWNDDEDNEICVKEALASQGRRLAIPSTSSDEYTHALKRKFESVMGVPKWAELGRSNKINDTDDESDNELLQHCGNFLAKKSSILHRGTIELKRLKDLNRDTYSEGPVIKSVQFHPSATVALVAGLSGVASLFQVDGHNNTKLQSVQFERFPIRCSHFTMDGEKFIVGSQHHSHYYKYDMIAGKSMCVNLSQGGDITNMKNFEMSPDGHLIAVSGKFGNIHFLSAHTDEYLFTLKMNGEVTSIAFSADGSRLFSHGDCGEVYVWDMGSRTCLHRFVDDGCIVGSSLALSPNGQYLACGSRSGVVNIYESASLTLSSAPRPAKILLNLTTAVTSLQFNSSSEILAMASDDKKNALKLVHFPSMTVFSNFPAFESKISRPQCLNFSRNSGYLSVGNNKSTALLYRLKHYGNY